MSESSCTCNLQRDGRNRTECSIADAQAPIEIATTRKGDRVAASAGLLQQAEPQFQFANNVMQCGSAVFHSSVSVACSFQRTVSCTTHCKQKGYEVHCN